ncbi:hypothetical protein [Sphaerisporangium sp. TRM90804]|uniref:hypothetical protein n=1 Tax=Sphaerisporangium sp. TRM90804 TaxID=3031113 RepID=UPI00244874A6|nr:hypothetical protein [Sphaerisporangium sp. TRM90804]MDH2427419.1 hypothetical protein [Sphaerisporangium sp. TRM90804]
MPPEQQKPSPPEHSIAIWGAPGSGKTTFLAALNIALMHKKGPWRIFGSDGPSSDFLVEMTTALSKNQSFPEATQAIGNYRWVLSRKADDDGPGRSLRPKPKTAHRIGLDVVDAPGGFYHAQRAKAGPDREALLDNLERSSGIVYLFDPIREFKSGDAFDFLHGVLTDLAGRMLSNGEYADDMLPHHLAVCVTKFDDLRVLRTAQKLGMLMPDPDDQHSFPRVDDDYAEELFQELCSVSSSGYAGMVVPALKQFFRREQIKFFVTSSIGFFVDPAKGSFDLDDPQNLLPEAPRHPGEPAGPGGPPAKRYRIRGPVYPINVVEPMLWLGQRMAAQAPRRTAGR